MCIATYEDKLAQDPYDLSIINHSPSPNMTSVFNDYNDGYVYALCDIKEGEELTETYNTYPDLPFFDWLMKQHGIVEDYCYNTNLAEPWR